jgi:8-oxo-dGTP pyrophosphatase MutT (NUDIX family)
LPAATVIVVRDAGAGFEVLLLKRSDHGQFGNMWVFPGGRVDDDDAGANELERARHAAVREALEEVGLEVDPTTIHPFSHWTPPPIQPRRYVTWFFVAEWTGGQVTIDGHEIVDHRWIAPQAALDEGLPMAPPTIVTLHDLAAAGSFDATRRPDDQLPHYLTRPARSSTGGPVLLWHGDAGYESGDADVDGPRHRLWYTPGGPWRYETSA